MPLAGPAWAKGTELFKLENKGSNPLFESVVDGIAGQYKRNMRAMAKTGIWPGARTIRTANRPLWDDRGFERFDILFHAAFLIARSRLPFYPHDGPERCLLDRESRQDSAKRLPPSKDCT